MAISAILPETSHSLNPQDVVPARSPGHSIRDRSAKQLTFGPSEAVKQRPTIARLRDAMDAFNIRGTCRLVAYELLTYWEPGGQVFPLVKTLAAGLGKSERVVQRQLDRLERVGLSAGSHRSGSCWPSRTSSKPLRAAAPKGLDG